MSLAAANAAAVWTVNHQTWAAGILAFTNAASSILLVLGLIEWHHGRKNQS